jgi:hypothetical protein
MYPEERLDRKKQLQDLKEKYADMSDSFRERVVNDWHYVPTEPLKVEARVDHKWDRVPKLQVVKDVNFLSKNITYVRELNDQLKVMNKIDTLSSISVNDRDDSLTLSELEGGGRKQRNSKSITFKK